MCPAGTLGSDTICALGSSPLLSLWGPLHRAPPAHTSVFQVTTTSALKEDQGLEPDALYPLLCLRATTLCPTCEQSHHSLNRPRPEPAHPAPLAGVRPSHRSVPAYWGVCVSPGCVPLRSATVSLECACFTHSQNLHVGSHTGEHTPARPPGQCSPIYFQKTPHPVPA